MSGSDGRIRTAAAAAMHPLRPLPLLAMMLALLAQPLLAVPVSAQPATVDQVAQQANRRFVEAMQALNKADQTYDQSEQAKYLREADRLLTQIVTETPESPLAVQLITNQFVGDFDYGEFKRRIAGLVCADAQSIACFLHRIEALMTPIEYPIAAPRWDWLSLAVAHHHLGNKDRVRPIIAPFLAAMRRNDPTAEAGQDLFLARALALTGEVPLALDITRGIADCSTRIYNLTDIADALTWKGDKERAGQVADEAAEFARANNCSWELGLVAQALLKTGKESRARTLFLNTVEEQFSRFKDRRGTCCPPELAVAAGDLGDPNLALGLLRTVQDESPWTVPQVLGKLGARGEQTITLAYADQVKDPEIRAEAYVELIVGALAHGDRKQAELVSSRLDELLSRGPVNPLVTLQRARTDKLLGRGEAWRASLQRAITEAERDGSADRRDFASPLLAALVEIGTGKPLLQ